MGVQGDEWMKDDLYQRLGVARAASFDSIRRAYRKKAMAVHPDRNPGDEEAAAAFRAIRQAYEILSDKERRAAYDRTGEIVDGIPQNELKEIAGFVKAALQQVMQKVLDDGLSVAHQDMVDLVRQAMNQFLANGKKIKSDFLKLLASLTEVIERTTTEREDGANLIVGAAREQKETAEKKLVLIEEEMKNIAASIEHLKNYGFRYVERPDGFGWGWGASPVGAATTFRMIRTRG